MIRESEQVGNFVAHEDHATDLPAGIGHHFLFFNSYCVNYYESSQHTDIYVVNLVEDNEDNPDEDFGDNEVNATQSRKFVSAREYYCFKLQVRKKLLNIILFGGRLFQQWAVDRYIKIESMRLDWYSKPKNQKVIRADLYQVTCLCLF